MESVEGSRPKGRRGRGRGRLSVGGGEKGGWAAKKGQKGKRATTRVSLREKRNDATDDSDLASNGPQPFSDIHAPNSTFGNIFLGYYKNCRTHQFQRTKI
jgi:hypothetical protein